MKKAVGILCALLMPIAGRAQNSAQTDLSSVPENLGLGLRQLAALAQQDANQARAAVSSSNTIMSDPAGRVIVNINLDGTSTAGDVAAKLTALGLEIVAVEPNWRNGVISAWLPLAQAATVAQLPGVRSVTLAPKPIRHAGVVIAESSFVERAREVNTPGTVTAQGLLGRNISIGIVSDSFDQAPWVPRASVGVVAGDLPGPGNPDGYTQPVVVLYDDSTSGVADEGRAMAEIVHDIAPAAKICFSAAGQTQATMSNSIRNLRVSIDSARDIIVDDIAFLDEPVFSDGMIALAVEDVVSSSGFSGKKVSYFSASGNNPGGYSADANIISSSTGLAHRVWLIFPHAAKS